VESAVVGQRYGKAYGLHYKVRCDAMAHAVWVAEDRRRRRTGIARRRRGPLARRPWPRAERDRRLH
jgi:hypothetical protein